MQNSLFSKKAELEAEYFNSVKVLRPGGNGLYSSYSYEPVECNSISFRNKVHDNFSF